MSEQEENDQMTECVISLMIFVSDYMLFSSEEDKLHLYFKKEIYYYIHHYKR